MVSEVSEWAGPGYGNGGNSMERNLCVSSVMINMFLSAYLLVIRTAIGVRYVERVAALKKSRSTVRQSGTCSRVKPSTSLSSYSPWN